MKENPTSALDAILETEKKIDNIKVYPITLARYALLELTESPFINSTVKYTTMSVIPTIYIMTQEIDKLKRFNSKNVEELISEAMEYANDLEPTKMENVITEIANKVKELFKIAPEASSDTKVKSKGKKQETVG